MGILGRMRTAARVLLGGASPAPKRVSIPEISAEEVQEFKQFFPREKFFIFGHARSGTTLLTRLIRLHPEVHCNYQAHFFTRRPLLKSLVDPLEAQEWLSRRSNRWNRGRDLSPVVLRAVAEYILEREAATVGKPIVGDKSPSSTIHGQAVRDLHAVFPEAKLLYIVRDGRDVLISERFRNFVEDSRYLSRQDEAILARLRDDPAAFSSRGESLFTTAFVQRVAGGWATNVTEVDAEGRRLFGSRYLALRFEDLLQQPIEVMSQVWGLLDASPPDNETQFAIKSELASNPDEEWQTRRNQQVAEFLTKGQVGGWKRFFTQRDKADFRASAGEALIAWRYEESSNW